MPTNKPKRNKKHQPKLVIDPRFAITRRKQRDSAMDYGEIASKVIPLFARIDELKRGEATERGICEFLVSIVYFECVVAQAWQESAPEARVELQRIKRSASEASDAIEGILQRFDRTGKIGADSGQLRALGEFAQACEHLLAYNNMHVIHMANMMYAVRLEELSGAFCGQSAGNEERKNQTHAAPHQRARANGHSSHPVKNGCAGL